MPTNRPATNTITITREEVVEERCPTCGNLDTLHVCSRCGTPLRRDILHAATLRQVLRANITEVVQELIDPLFAFIKTFWLLFIQTELFFKTLFYRNRPVANIPFPLEPLWRRLSPGTYQYVLDPIKYILALVILMLILPDEIFSTLIGPQSFFASPLWDTVSSNTIADRITVEIAAHLAPLFTLVLFSLFLGLTAHIFRLPLLKTPPAGHALNVTQQVYLYWFYTITTLLIILYAGWGAFGYLYNLGAEGNTGPAIALVALAVGSIFAVRILLITPFFIWQQPRRRLLVAIGLALLWFLALGLLAKPLFYVLLATNLLASSLIRYAYYCVLPMLVAVGLYFIWQLVKDSIPIKG